MQRLNYTKRRDETGSVRELATYVVWQAVKDVRLRPTSRPGKDARRWLARGGEGLLPALDIDGRQVVAALDAQPLQPNGRTRRRKNT